jgi:hypothetical protein
LAEASASLAAKWAFSSARSAGLFSHARRASSVSLSRFSASSCQCASFAFSAARSLLVAVAAGAALAPVRRGGTACSIRARKTDSVTAAVACRWPHAAELSAQALRRA